MFTKIKMFLFSTAYKQVFLSVLTSPLPHLQDHGLEKWKSLSCVRLWDPMD